MKTQKMIDTDYKILKTLALEGEADLEALAQKVGKHYTSIMRRLKFLEKEYNAVYVSRLETTPRKGRERKIYNLTLTGLFLLLGLRSSWKYIDQIAEKQQDKLLIFKKWNFLAKRGLRNYVVDTLKVIMSMIAADIIRDALIKKRVFGLKKPVDYKKTEFYLSEILDRAILCPFFEKSPEYMREEEPEEWERIKRFLKEVKKDPEIWDYIMGCLDENKRLYSRFLETIGKWEYILQKI